MKIAKKYKFANQLSDDEMNDTVTATAPTITTDASNVTSTHPTHHSTTLIPTPTATDPTTPIPDESTIS